MPHSGKEHWLRRYDWDAIAGIVAALSRSRSSRSLENPQVTRIEFVLDEGERANWRDHVVPKLAACRGREKVVEPRWCTLHESVSFILGDRNADGQAEALSFWASHSWPVPRDVTSRATSSTSMRIQSSCRDWSSSRARTEWRRSRIYRVQTDRIIVNIILNRVRALTACG